MQIPASELILNKDGSIYHLQLQPDQVADTIITVGDPKRVALISQHFDRIDHKVYNREFVTHTGNYKGKPLTVIATGIGTDNIDIVFNELDALVNIDLKTREVRKKLRQLRFIRIGTSGSMQADIPINSTVISSAAIGMGGLLNFYDYQSSPFERKLQNAFQTHFGEPKLPQPYVAEASSALLEKFHVENIKGITVTCPGFYAPQGRILRATAGTKNYIQKLNSFQSEELRITNFEMETAGIYGLAKLLGHQAISISAILANRITNEFSKEPKKVVEGLIDRVLSEL